MVSSGVCSLTRTVNKKFRNMKIVLPMGPPDVISTDHEIDFSVVFGPIPVNPSVEVNRLISNKFFPRRDYDRKNYHYLTVLRNRSHGLVGPSHITQLLKHASLETNILRDHGACSIVETEVQQKKTCSHDDVEKDNQTKEVTGVGLEDFEVLKLVGRGAFGKVFQVRKKDTLEIFAMKVMRKDKIIEKNHVEFMKAERDILTKVDHPFVVRLRYSFQTKYRLYLVLDFVNGGHLLFQLCHQGLFREDLARVYAAEIVSAVSHLHANGIMHRDLKPENILVDADGHVMLTDFGLAKEFNGNDRSHSLCGTVDYMAPEIITGKGHDKAADWWSFGVLLFEMLTGKRPFVGGNRDKIQQKIVKEKMKLPSYLSAEAHSLLKGLLQKEANKRLGNGPGGSNEIKNHKWFKPINWRKLEAREIQPSFRPNVADRLCVANFDKKLTSMPLVDSPVASPVAGGELFVNFSYVSPNTFLQKQSLLQSQMPI